MDQESSASKSISSTPDQLMSATPDQYNILPPIAALDDPIAPPTKPMFRIIVTTGNDSDDDKIKKEKAKIQKEKEEIKNRLEQQNDDNFDDDKDDYYPQQTPPPQIGSDIDTFDSDITSDFQSDETKHSNNYVNKQLITIANAKQQKQNYNYECDSIGLCESIKRINTYLNGQTFNKMDYPDLISDCNHLLIYHFGTKSIKNTQNEYQLIYNHLNKTQNKCKQATCNQYKRINNGNIISNNYNLNEIMDIMHCFIMHGFNDNIQFKIIKLNNDNSGIDNFDNDLSYNTVMMSNLSTFLKPNQYKLELIQSSVSNDDKSKRKDRIWKIAQKIMSSYFGNK